MGQAPNARVEQRAQWFVQEAERQVRLYNDVVCVRVYVCIMSLAWTDAHNARAQQGLNALC